MDNQSVLVINSGSSSIKYQLVIPDNGTVLASGLVERIGQELGDITHKVNESKFAKQVAMPDHKVGLEQVVNMFNEYGPALADANVVAIGHRVVQGGKTYDKATLITDEVLKDIKDLSELAPLHNPANAIGIEVARKMFDVPNVAVFDTAFFTDLPTEAATYAINAKVAQASKIRRYGAHGTSHQFVGNGVRKFLGATEKDDFKQVVLHLGNGASASAQLGSHPVETSMGLTPLQGLVMGTRTGDLDPAVVFHLARTQNMSIDEIDTLMNKQSGMLGLCGKSDMRDVWQAIDEGDKNTKDAIDVYVHRLAFYVGAYIAILGGIDALTFTAGIGENDNRTREQLCKRLAFFGIDIDDNLNNVRSDEPRIISKDDAKVKVLVYPTNEELAIAQSAIKFV